MLSKASMLHGMEALSSLAGLKLKPQQGRAQTNGAVSDSPTAPISPLIAAKNPFAQVGIVMLSTDLVSLQLDLFLTSLFPVFF